MQAIEDTNPVNTFTDLGTAQLVELALENGEGKLASNGALVVYTGHRTSRHPNDRFVVQEPSTEEFVDWGAINQPFDASKFDEIGRAHV